MSATMTTETTVTIDALLALMLFERLSGVGSYEYRHASAAEKLGRPEVAERLRALEAEKRELERPDLSVSAEIDVERRGAELGRCIREMTTLAMEVRKPLEQYLWAQLQREQGVLG